MGENVSVKIGTAYNKRGTQEAKNDFKGLESSVQSSSQNIATNLAMVTVALSGIIQAIKSAKGFMDDLTEKYAAQEAAETSLKKAIEITGNAYTTSVSELKSYASKLQDLTSVGDEVILQGQAQLEMLTSLNQEGLQKLTPAILDFATAMDVDYKTAFQLAGKSIGTSTNALARYGIEIDTTLSKEEKLSAVIKEMNSRFKGISEELRSQTVGSLQAYKNEIGDLKEELGKGFEEVLRPGREAITEWIHDNKEQIGLIAQHLPEIFKIAGEGVIEILQRTFEYDSLKTVYNSLRDGFLDTMTATFMVIGDLWDVVITSMSDAWEDLGDNFWQRFMKFGSAREQMPSTFDPITGTIQYQDYSDPQNFADSFIKQLLGNKEELRSAFSEYLSTIVAETKEAGEEAGKLYADIIEDKKAKIDALLTDNSKQTEDTLSSVQRITEVTTLWELALKGVNALMEDLQNASGKLEGDFEGFGNALNALSDGFENVENDIKETLKDVSLDMARGLVDGLSAALVEEDWEEVGRVFAEALGSILGGATGMGDIWGEILGLVYEIINLIVVAVQASDLKRTELDDAFEDLIATALKRGDSWNDVKKVIGDKLMDSVVWAIINVGTASDEIEHAVDLLASALDKAWDSSSGTFGDMSEVEEALDHLKEEYNEAAGYVAASMDVISDTFGTIFGEELTTDDNRIAEWGGSLAASLQSVFIQSLKSDNFSIAIHEAFDDVLKQAVIESALKAADFEELGTSIAEALTDGILSDSEISLITGMYENASYEVASAYNSLAQALGWDTVNVDQENDYSVYGGNTTVQRAPDIYLYQYFNAPILGDGGMVAFGELTVEAIQSYLGAGGVFEISEN